MRPGSLLPLDLGVAALLPLNSVTHPGAGLEKGLQGCLGGQASAALTELAGTG